MGVTARTFVAIDISDDVRRRVLKARKDLERAPCRVKWVEPGNLHITLKFLGDVDRVKLVSVIDIIREAAKGVAPFELFFSGLGYFPAGGRKPRVVWVGIEDPSGSAARLARELDDKLMGLDIEPDDRPFRAHLTIGRVKNPKGAPDLAKRIDGTEYGAFGSTTVREVVLYESELTPGGPVYKAIDSARLTEV